MRERRLVVLGNCWFCGRLVRQEEKGWRSVVTRLFKCSDRPGRGPHYPDAPSIRTRAL